MCAFVRKYFYLFKSFHQTEKNVVSCCIVCNPQFFGNMAHYSCICDGLQSMVTASLVHSTASFFVIINVPQMATDRLGYYDNRNKYNRNEHKLFL